MTTPAAYTLVAMFVAPSFVQMGFPLLGAHMFLFFFAIKSGSTPPVAVVAAVAAGIAEADFWNTALKSTIFGTASFLVAFGFLFNPALFAGWKPGFYSDFIHYRAYRGVGHGLGGSGMGPNPHERVEPSVDGGGCGYVYFTRRDNRYYWGRFGVYCIIVFIPHKQNHGKRINLLFNASSYA